MRDYEIIGVGKKTNRNRKRVYRAESEDAAKLLAEKDGTLPESINLLPPELASEDQLSYAKSLGISISKNSTRDQMSYLISSKTEVPATNEQINYAIKLGIKFYEYDFKSKVAIQHKLNSLFGHNSPSYNAELAKWYVHSIARYLTKGNWPTPDKSKIPENIVEETVRKLTEDEKSFKSFLRQMEYEDPFEMIGFGQITDENGRSHEGASRNTAAYKLVSKLLRENLSINKTRKISNTKKRNTEIEETSNAAIWVVVILILLYILF